MKHLAELIRKGLKTPGIVEDNEIFGAAIYEEKLRANVVGLALIGKIGVDESVKLFEAAFEEIGADHAPASNRINSELGVNNAVLESMIARHWQTSAEHIAGEFEAGTFVVD
jgi:hypothetical protein